MSVTKPHAPTGKKGFQKQLVKKKKKQARRTAMDRSKRLQLKEESTHYLRFLQVLTPTIQRSIAAQRS